MNQREALEKVLDFVERWNKLDEELEVAEAASLISRTMLDKKVANCCKDCWDDIGVDTALGCYKRRCPCHESKLEGLDRVYRTIKEHAYD